MGSPVPNVHPAMSGREVAASVFVVFAAAVVVAAWATTFLVFPRPEDVGYYVGVARNLLGGHGLTSDAIWSYATPPLAFPRPAFEIWLPMATFMVAIPMSLLGPTFIAAQLSSVVVGGITAVLAWRLGADVAAERRLPAGRARTLALGCGLTAAVYLPLVLASAEPDSTIPFAALSLGACILMGRLLAIARADRDATERIGLVSLVALGVLLGAAALTRNEAIWLALAWAILSWRLAAGRRRTFARLVGVPAMVGLAIFVPWMVRDWLAFGSPLPGQVTANALALNRQDIFAWKDTPTLQRYLDAGLGRLLELRWEAFIYDLAVVLIALGIPVGILGAIGLPAAARRGGTLLPLTLFGLITFTVTTLVFPVVTTSGTFLHAAGAVHVLLIAAALLGCDWLIATVAARRGWTRPVAWLGPAFTIGASLLFTIALLPSQGATTRAFADRYAALPAILAAAGAPLPTDGSPVITDHAISLAEETGTRSLALPYESLASIVDLARTFHARLLILHADDDAIWPAIFKAGGPGSECIKRVVPDASAVPQFGGGELHVYRIDCP
jgi:hypothetical protein